MVSPGSSSTVSSLAALRTDAAKQFADAILATTPTT
jgi:hypothetical protein